MSMAVLDGPRFAVPPEPLPAPEPLARLSHVSKRFGTVAALHDVSLDVPRGRILGIIGRSGAGKSTLIRLLNGLERPDSGSVQFEGQELAILSERGLQPVRQRIGMIFQHFNLLSAKTVADNIALPLRIARMPEPARARRVEELLDLVGLPDKARAFPAQLSGGQRQRVGIARALAAEPALLLSDEATSALDPETTASILALLRGISQRLGLGIVLITHETSVIRAVADEVAVLEGGRLVEQGSVAGVLFKPQSASARSFADAARPQLPAALRASLLAHPEPRHDLLLRIDLSGIETRRPLLSDLAAALGVETILVHGGIDQAGGQPAGRLYVSLRDPRFGGTGPGLEERALAYLADKTTSTEVAGYVPRAS